MRRRLMLPALALVIVPFAPDARAQDSASRVEVLAIALGAVRAGRPGRVIVHLPPQSLQAAYISRSEIVEAAKRAHYTVTEDPKGITGPPVQSYLRLEHAIIRPNEASILIAVAERKPDGSYMRERTDKAILTRAGGQWQVTVVPYFAVR